MSDKIIRLTVSNILKIKAAEVQPDGNLVVIAGANGQGKSSLLNSIALALSGKDLPTQPIRQGAATGSVILQTENLVVTRRFSQTGGSTLEVRDKEGAKVTSPQAKLDALLSKATFDPFEFTRMKPAQQVEIVKRVAGLDFAEHEATYRRIYDQRTDINRQAKLQEGKLAGVTRYSDAPVEPVSVTALLGQLEELRKQDAVNEDLKEALVEMVNDVETHEGRVASKKKLIAEMEDALEGARQDLLREEQLLADQIKMRDQQQQAVASIVVTGSSAEILEQINNAEVINQKVASNQRWNEEHRALVALQQQSTELTAQLTELDEEKQNKLELAKFPVPGLGFNEAGVTYDNLPFEQSATSVQIRVSVAMARSLNPGLPVMLIRDGSLLDENSLALLQKEADEHGSQIWLEVVGTDHDDATVIIEDGSVVATPAATKKKAAAKATA